MPLNLMGLASGNQAAKKASDVSIQALQKKKPGEVNKSLATAKEHSKNIMQGSDSTTNQILNKFSEQSAAGASARRGAEAQRAELSGASTSLQNVMGQLTNRDIQQQKQESLGSLARDLGARADQQAGQLAQIGQFEEQMDFSKEQAKVAEEQWDKKFDLTADQWKKQFDLTSEQWDKKFGLSEDKFKWEKGLTDKTLAQKEFDLVLSTADLTSDPGLEAAKAAALKAGYENMTFDKLKADQWDLKEDKANTELLTHITTNIGNYWDESDGAGKYNTSKALGDPKVVSMLEDLWKSENNGTMGDLDMNDPDDMAWIKSKLDSAFTTDKDIAMKDFIDSFGDYEFPEGTSDEQKQDFFDSIQEAGMLIKSGIKIEFKDGKITFTDAATGTEFGGTAIFDKSGNEYDPISDNEVKVGDSIWTKDENGEWIGDVDIKIKMNKGFGDLLTSKISSGDLVENDDGTFTNKEGKVIYKKVGSSWFKVDKGSPDANTKKHLELATKKSKDPITGETTGDIPDGTKEGDAYVTDGEIFIKEGDEAIAVDMNNIGPNSLHWKNVVGLAKDDPDVAVQVVEGIKQSPGGGTKAPIDISVAMKLLNSMSSGNKLNNKLAGKLGADYLSTTSGNLERGWFTSAKKDGRPLVIDGIPYKVKSYKEGLPSKSTTGATLETENGDTYFYSQATGKLERKG